MKHAMDVKLNVKPVYSNVIHTAVWEGPCRTGRPELLTPEYESRAGREQFRVWSEEVRQNLSNRANILEPTFIEYNENFVISDDQLKEIAPNPSEIDLFLITYRIPGIERLGRPVSMIKNGPTPIDLVAFYRDIGMEAYMAHDYEEFNELIELLQVKKAIAHTRLLVLTAGEQFPVSVNSSNPDIFSLTRKYGIRSVRRSFRDVFEILKRQEDSEERAVRASEIYESAVDSSVDEACVLRDLKYHDAVVEMMEMLDCNAFTTACKELCASRLPMGAKVTPCMTHSVMRDSRIPTACEEDINVWMAILVLMYLTERAPFMGNPSLVHKNRRPIEDLGMTRLVSGPQEGFEEEVLEIRHAVPPTRMLGYDKEALPYELGSFTNAGWGTKFQVNMGDAPEKEVTIARFDRHGDKMLVTRGTIVGCAYRDDECSPAVYYHIEGGARAFRHALANGGYGHHLAVVYGDWIKKLKQLSDVVGFELEVFE